MPTLLSRLANSISVAMMLAANGNTVAKNKMADRIAYGLTFWASAASAASPLDTLVIRREHFLVHWEVAPHARLPRPIILGLLSERSGSGWIVSANVRKSVEELIVGSRGKYDLQNFIPFRSLSASAKTASMSYPAPASISFSPRASNRSISSSC